MSLNLETCSMPVSCCLCPSVIQGLNSQKPEILIGLFPKYVVSISSNVGGISHFPTHLFCVYIGFFSLFEILYQNVILDFSM